MNDGIAELVNAAHSLEGGAGEWLTRVVRAASTALGRGVVGNLVERRSDGTLASVCVALHGIANEWRHTLERTAARTCSAELEARFTTAVTNERGVLALSARGDDRTALLLDAPLDPRTERAADDDDALLATWRRVADRLADALRRRAKAKATTLRMPPAATFDDADADVAWHALLEGRLALVDRFDRDGRRFVVVRASGPDEPDALSAREREVLALVAFGHANKRIAHALGVSESTVSAALRGAARKLGVRSRVELARILGPRRI